MIDTLSSAMLAWLLTYLIHSTVLLGLALALTRARAWQPAVLDVMWKTALVGGLVTATAQLALEVRPAGSVSLERRAESTPPMTLTDRAPIAQAPQVVAPPAADLDRSERPVADAQVSTDLAPRASAALPLRTAAVLAWILVGLALGLAYAARRLILVGRIGDRRAVLDEQLLAELDQLTCEAGLRRSPRLTSTERISSPIALGLAEICVPETALTELDPEQQRSMLAHELAHLTRRDPLWLAFASLVERVLWIQPLNRVARRQIATSAEYLCDEWAVKRTGSGVALARCLAQVAEWIQASPLGVPVAGMAEERSLLVSRVEKLLAARASAPRSRRVLVMAATAVMLATIAIAPGVFGSAATASDAVSPPYGLDDSALGPKSRNGIEKSNDAEPVRDGHASSAIARSENESDAEQSTHVEPSARQRTARDSSIVIALIARLKDEDVEVRQAAAQALGRLEDPRAIPALITALSDDAPHVRAAAAEALSDFHDPRAINRLTALLADQDRDVRRHALEALSEYESGVPAEPIARLASDPDAQIRHSAAHALGKLGDRGAGAALATLVRDRSPDVRSAAIESIAQLHDGSHTAAIVSALADSDADVRRQALEALDDLKTPIAEATLLALLRDRDADVREKAVEVVGERSVVAAVPTLRRMLEDPDEEVREEAVSALAEMADDAAAEALRAALTSKDAKVRRAAIEAIGERRP